MKFKYGMSKDRQNCVSFIYLISVAEITNFIRHHNMHGHRALVLVA
jgi:hypothetical protein